MSDAWAMNAGKASTAVGTATIEADDELFTITGHGLGVGDTVMVDTLTGGAVGVLDEGQVYWVVDVSTDTFALSQHRNGAPVAFSTDGGADVYRFAPQYSAAELRRLFSGLMWPGDQQNDNGAPSHFGAREGIRPTRSDTPVVTVSGTTWTVADVWAAIDPRRTSTQGPYWVAHPSESGSLNPADGTDDRIDALDLQLQDNDADSSGFRRARVVYVPGTAGSGTPPSLTTDSLRLGTILVPSGGTPAPSVQTLARHTAALGGILTVQNVAELSALGGGTEHVGMYAHIIDDDMLVRRGASGGDVVDDWSTVATPGGWQRISNGSGTGASIDVDLTAGGKFPAGTFDTIRLRATGYLSAANQIAVRVNDQAGSNYRRQSLAFVAATPAFGDGEQNQNGTAWLASWWGPTFRNSMTFEMYRCADNVAIPVWHQGGNVEDLGNNLTFGTGRYSLSIIPNKLTFTCGGNTFSEFVWELEGYRK